MADIVIFDPLDSVVAGRVTDYLQSVNTPDYDSVADKVVNPDLSALEAVPVKYWKHDSGSIVEMIQAEKDAWDNSVATALNLNRRELAKQIVDTQEELGKIIRVLAEITRSEINILRAQHGLADRTLSQLKTAMKNQIDSGNVD